jgi:Methylmalonyl Co-A mutase-associated GTPase MeaB
MSTTTGSLAERVRAGDTRALARAISLIEDDDPGGWDLVAELYPHTGGASVVGVTGPPGGSPAGTASRRSRTTCGSPRGRYGGGGGPGRTATPRRCGPKVRCRGSG